MEDLLTTTMLQIPSQHHLQKVCNRNTLKVSYSCMPNMVWLQLYPATTKTFSITSRSQRPPYLLATVAIQQTALSMENAAKKLTSTKPRSHLMAPPNIICGAPKVNSRSVITITPTPSDIERKEMRQISQKQLGINTTGRLAYCSSGKRTLD